MANLVTKFNVGDKVFVINNNTNRAERITIDRIIVKQFETKTDGLVNDVVYATKLNTEEKRRKPFMYYKERNVFATLDELTESIVKAVTVSLKDETKEEE